MDQFNVIWQGRLEAESPKLAERQLDGVMEQLLDCSEITDPSLGWARSTGVVEIEGTVEAVDSLDAVQKASTLIRAAVHAAGIASPGWPTAEQLEAVSITFEHSPKVEPVLT